VQADGALVELARIEHAVNRFERVDGQAATHYLDGFTGLDRGLPERDVLMLLHENCPPAIVG